MRRFLLVLLVGCGRVHFDALADGDAPRLTYRDAVLADSPVAYWRFDDTDTIARDEVGNLDGMYSGNCMQGASGALAGDPSAALRLDGATCRVDFAGQLGFLGRAPFSLEAWVELSSSGGIQPFFMNETRVGQNPVDGFAMLDSSIGAYFERPAGGANNTSRRYTLTVGTFTHLVGVYDGTALYLYADAQVAGQGTNSSGALDSTGAVAVIGAYPPGTGNLYLHGVIDEVAVYDRALSLDRIGIHLDLGRNGPQ